MRIKQLEWSVVKGYITDKWYAKAMGIEWTIPVSNGMPGSDNRVKNEKDKAQAEFERAVKNLVEDPDLFTMPKSDENNSADNFYLCVLEKIFGKVTDEAWRRVLTGDTPPWPLADVLEGMSLVPRSEVTKLEMQLRARAFSPIHDVQPFPPSIILNADVGGTPTITAISPKSRAVNRLIQAHVDLSRQHDEAVHAGQPGFASQFRLRLSNLESALAIAVKDADIAAPTQEKKE